MTEQLRAFQYEGMFRPSLAEVQRVVPDAQDIRQYNDFLPEKEVCVRAGNRYFIVTPAKEGVALKQETNDGVWNFSKPYSTDFDTVYLKPYWTDQEIFDMIEDTEQGLAYVEHRGPAWGMIANQIRRDLEDLNTLKSRRAELETP